MAPKKTIFNLQWLDVGINAGFALWLTDVPENKHQAHCKVCHKTFELSNMGRRAILSHENGPNHIKLMKVKSQQGTLSSFFTPKQLSDTSETLTQSPPVKISKHSDLESYLLNDDVTKAEVIWALNVVAKGFSFNSCKDISKIFSMMFSDSRIANKFQMGGNKVGYMVSHGLAPYFKQKLLDRLKACNVIVICFDESLNKVVQRGQMDINVRFWDGNENKVITRYYNSAFMGRASAEDILDNFLTGIQPLSITNVLQVSMDGPNVNLKFLSKLEHYISNLGNSQKTSLVDLGTCGLHVVHGSLKTGLKSANWNIDTVLRHVYYLFNDSPARRASFTEITGGTMFPLKFCQVRWVENSKCIERALLIVENVAKFVSDASLKASKPAATLKTACQDPLLKCKLAFTKTVADELEPFLRRYQSTLPLSAFIKPNTLQDANTASKLLSIDLNASENCLPRKKVDIGFAAAAILRSSKLSELQVAEFQFGCSTLLTALVQKLFERSPLKFPLVRGLSSLDPAIVIHKPSIGKSRFSEVLKLFHLAKRINDTTAEKAKQQYSMLCTEAVGKLQNAFTKFLEAKTDDVGLDSFFGNMLASDSRYSDLWSVFKMCFILSHGNAAVESGFSVNKSLLVENLLEETIVNQRHVYDTIQEAGGIEYIPIDKKMLNSARSSHRMYHERLEQKKRQETEQGRKATEKKAIEKEIENLKRARMALQKDTQLQEAEIDNQMFKLQKKMKM